MIYKDAPEFFKEFKKLLKKYRTLEEDLDAFKTVIEYLYEHNEDKIRDAFRQKFYEGKKATVLIQGDDDLVVVKARLDCAYLNSDPLRIVLVKYETTVTFVEIFNKKDKKREDTARVKKYVKAIRNFQ